MVPKSIATNAMYVWPEERYRSPASWDSIKENRNKNNLHQQHKELWKNVVGHNREIILNPIKFQFIVILSDKIFKLLSINLV